MRWFGLIAAGLLAWVMLDIFHSPGPAFVVVCAAMGVVLASQRKQLQALRERVERLEGMAGAQPEPSPQPQHQPHARAEPTTDPARPPVVAVPQAAPVVEIQIPAPAALPATTASPVLPAVAAAEPPSPFKDLDESALHVTTSVGQSVVAWFKGGNTIVRIAVVVLFMGVAFLLRYAAEHSLLPLELRIAAVALGGLALAVTGWRLRESRRGYGLSLQGAGVGIVYLTLFAAYRLYELVPATLTFALLVMLALVTALLAVRQNAMALAVLGFGGGFLAPVLASSGSGNHVALFSYYLVLNLAIAWIAQRQTWKPLNLLAFVFTFGIGSAWGVKSYTAAQFWNTEPFLVLHFLLFLYISVQYTRQLVAAQEAQGTALPTVDASLLFGVPIAAFGLQAAMLKDQPLALALSAAVMAGIYLLVGRWLWKVSGRRMLLMVEGLLALGVIFLLLVTPLALNAQWTGVAWAIQGAGVVWIGLRQRRWWAAGMGLLMQLGAAISFWAVAGYHNDLLPIATLEGFTPFLNTVFVSALVLALAALVTAFMAYREQLTLPNEPPQGLLDALRLAHVGMLVLGLLQALAAFWPELRMAAGPQHDAAACVLMFAAFAALTWTLALRWVWPALSLASRVLGGMSVVATVLVLSDALGVQRLWAHYTQQGHVLVAALAIVAVVWRLRRAQPAAWPLELWLPLAAALLHGGLLAYAALAHGVAQHEGWAASAAVALPTATALWLLGRARQNAWPASPPHHATLWRFLHLPWLLVLMVWMVGANLLSDGSMQPLPYLPLFNPTDLMHVFAAYYAVRLYMWAQAALPSETRRAAWIQAAAAMSFIWLNGLLVRSLHHWAGTPMWTHGALEADAVQTGLTILWTACAFITMVWAARRGQRKVWMAGAALLAVVVCKLFFFDLSQVGTLARIVSFMGVGGLMLVIGYLSPIPPAPAPKANPQEPA